MNEDKRPSSPGESHPALAAGGDNEQQMNLTFQRLAPDMNGAPGIGDVGVSTNLASDGQCSDAARQRAPETPKEKFRVWDVVVEAGFTKNRNSFCAELKYRGAELSATESVSRRFCPVVSVCGFYVGKARMAEIQQELPIEVDSREMALAYLAWALEPLAEILLLEGGSLPAWWSEGRLHRALLPWERELARLAAMPRCDLDYDWARVALRSLGELLQGADPRSDVNFEFDGKILLVRCGEGVIATPAQGKAWPEPVIVSVVDMGRLPTRLRRHGIQVLVRDEALIIHHHSYRRSRPKVVE